MIPSNRDDLREPVIVRIHQLGAQVTAVRTSLDNSRDRERSVLLVQAKECEIVETAGLASLVSTLSDRNVKSPSPSR